MHVRASWRLKQNIYINMLNIGTRMEDMFHYNKFYIAIQLFFPNVAFVALFFLHCNDGRLLIADIRN